MQFDKITKRMLEPALLVILTLAYYKLPWGSLPGPTEAWGIPFLLVYLLFLPGNMLRRILYPHGRSPVIRVVLGFLYGLFFFLFVSFLWTLTRADLSWLRLNLPGWIFLLYLVASMQRWNVNGTGTRSIPGWKSAFALLFVCIAIAVFVWKTGLPIGYSSDTLDHIAYVNEVQTTGEAFPESAFYAEAGQYGRDIRKGLLHVFYGFTGDYLSIDGQECLRIWNAIFIMILIGSIYGAAFILFGNEWIALLSSAFFVIAGIGGSDGATLREAFYSNRFAYVYFLFLVAFLMRYLHEPRWRDLFNCGCFAFAASAVHIFFAVLSGFAVAIIIVWKACFHAASFREHLRNTSLAFLAVALGIFPYGLFRYVTAYGTPNEIHDHIQGIVYLGSGLFVVNPVKLFSWFGLLGIASFFIAPAMWRRRKDNEGLGYLIAAGFTVPLVLLNPILLAPFYAALRYLVFRLPQLFPFYMMAAYYVVYSFRGIGGDKARTPLARLLCAGLLLAAVIDLLPILQKSPVSPAVLRSERQNSHLKWDDGLAYLRDHVPEGTVIISDPLTSYSIAAFTPHYVTCMYDQHAPPGDLLLSERLSMTRDVLNPFSPVSTCIDLMEAMDADYIVLNNRCNGTGLMQYWAMQPDLYFPIREKFISHEKLFRPRFHRNGFLVLEWTGRKPEEVEIAANPYYLQEIPPGFSHVGQQAGAANLGAFYLENTLVERGMELEISLIWSGSGEYPLRNYAVEFRFDHVDPGLPFGGRPFPKLSRKIKEAIKGSRYRFRVSHKILGGFLGPDVWPDNTYVLDHTAIALPDDITPGRYSISVELLVPAKMPNYRIRDFFFDDDPAQGAGIGSVMIE